MEWIVRGLRGGDERRDQLDSLPRHVDEPIAHEPEIVRPGELLGGFERPGDLVGARRQLVGETAREGREEVTLNPAHVFHGLQERLEELSDRYDDSRRGRHAYLSIAAGRLTSTKAQF